MLAPSGKVLYYRVPKKRGYTLSWFFCFDDPFDEYEFAYALPYSYTDLQRFLFRKDCHCANRPSLCYRRDLLCRTPMHRYSEIPRHPCAGSSR